ESGRLSGERVDGGAVFRGIPYAASPFGPNRFAAPQPVQPWSGVREAVEFGPACHQPEEGLPEDNPFFPFLGHLVTAPARADCLTLKGWTRGPAGGGLRVMVFIQGGGYLTGSGSCPAYDGRAFMRDGVVYVSFNYRLGADGFLHFADRPANRGLLDQIA